jgi:TonB family protein
VNRIGLVFLLFALATPTVTNAQDALCVKHIEAPQYDDIARAAHVTGVVTLAVTIDVDGQVTQVSRVSGPDILSKSAQENVKKWSFDNRSKAPVVLNMIYDYRILGKPSAKVVTSATFDLPGHVTVIVDPVSMETD